MGYSNAFSFNDPQGMCPECNGLGRKVGFVVEDLIDRSKSLNDGAIKVPFWTDWETGAYPTSGFFDNDKKLADYTPEEIDLLLYGKDRKYKLQIGDKVITRTYLGVIGTQRSTAGYIKAARADPEGVSALPPMRPCPRQGPR